MYYDESNRGKIQNPERGKQLIDYSGIKYGKITPTDIDGYIEYHNKAYIFYEYKFGNAQMPNGQRKALERLVDRLKTEAEAVLLVCQHNTEASDEINGAEALVRWVYYRGKWYSENQGRSVKQVSDAFINMIDKGDLNNPNN